MQLKCRDSRLKIKKCTDLPQANENNKNAEIEILIPKENSSPKHKMKPKTFYNSKSHTSL